MLLNAPERWVDDALRGFVLAHGGILRLLADHNRVVLRDPPAAAGRVAVVSGGGSGHEPAHAGFVGPGLLSAAVCGDVYCSPPVEAVLEAISAVATPAGVLLIVKNYTGDRLAFGLAAERARAAGVAVELVVVGDDVALVTPGAAPDAARRRGLAGTLLVHKVAGAAAEAGLPLAAVAAEARAAASRAATLGVGLSVATLPGCAPSQRLAAAAPGAAVAPRCELGLGIHGEEGAATILLPPLDDLVEQMLARLFASGCVVPLMPPPGGGGGGGSVVLLVNGLGGTPPAELCAAAGAAAAGLAHRGVAVARLIVGSLVTSLDAKGFSLTLMRVDDAPLLLARLDAPTGAPAWPALGRPPPPGAPGAPPHPPAPPPPPPPPPPAAADGGGDAGPPPSAAAAAAAALLGARLRACAAALQRLSPQLGDWDAAAGDGDCGATFARGAAAVLEDLPSYPLLSPARTAAALAASVRRSCGGTSGVLYDLLFTAAAAALRAGGGASDALGAAADAVELHGCARVGMRTMVDALAPAAAAARRAAAGGGGGGALAAAAAAARAGAESTRGMAASAGRAASVPAAALAGVPDPGAMALAAWLEAAAAVTRAE